MPVAVNHTKQKLKEGRLVLGLGVRLARSVEIGLIARAAGFDFLFLDREHSTMELSTAGEISTAALGQGVTPIVRVASCDAEVVALHLDSGAQGIAFPHVESAEDARRIVAAQMLPPLGSRSISRTTALAGFEPVPIKQFTQQVNDSILTVVMLESRAAIEQAEAIASVPCIDVLLIGTSDLCLDMGIAGEFGDPRIVDAYSTVISAARRHGKHAGVSGVRDADLMRKYISMGVRFAHVTSDTPLLIEAGTSRTKRLREIELDGK